jgi:long-subunit acyl-CoA synthetase (AMP-forming)
MQYKIADALVFSKIRERMGGKIRTFVSGGAALNLSMMICMGITGGNDMDTE